MTNRDKNEINESLLAMAFIEMFPMLTSLIMMCYGLVFVVLGLTILWFAFSPLLSLF